MRVLFIEVEMERDWAVASIGPAFLASYIKQFGYQAELVAFSIDWEIQKIKEIIAEKNPDVLAFSLTSRQWLRARDIAELAREYRDITTIAGGLHPTFAAETVLASDGFDYVCLGEGEGAFLEFLEHIKEGKEIRGIDNIQGKGEAKPKLRAPYPDLNQLPYMDRSFLNEHNGIVHMVTQRGCPFPCSYCAARMYNEMYGSKEYGRRRSIDDVLSEFAEIQANGNLNYVIFLDDTFTLNRPWVEEFCHRYEREFRVPFSLHARAETVNFELLKILADAGCAHITFGVESGSDRVRREIMKRRVTNKRLIDVFQWSKQLGIITTANYIIGTPTETPEEIEETIALHELLDPHDFGYFIFYPYPGTPLYHYCEENDLLPEDFFEKPANHRRSILKLKSLRPEDIEHYYQKFTQIREQTYLKRYGQYLSSSQKDELTDIMEDSAQKG